MKSKRAMEIPKYFLNPKGHFVIENYNQAKLFSNFFPGIAGLWGIPMWVFYVNRGQCISSFGIESKDKAIVEFQPANKAYRLTSIQGFRTFLKISSSGKILFWEPFQNNCVNNFFKTFQRMSITAYDLTIEDINISLGLKVQVHYFTLPEEPTAVLVRELKVINNSKKNYSVELIDGLPTIVPFGLTDGLIKNISRTVEAWTKVRNLKNKAPYFHLNVEISDTPNVTHIKAGNFYFSVDTTNSKGKLLEPIVEPSYVFGNCLDFVVPEKFLEKKPFKIPTVQYCSNRTPSAMSYAKFNLRQKAQHEIVSCIGHVHELSKLNKMIEKFKNKKFFSQKSELNGQIVSSIQNYALTKTSSLVFNSYCTQNFLDNVLRGGLPVSLKTNKGQVAFSVYSRKHGDLERDYNFFTLSPTYFSQGNGNYRDVNQNRRNDVWFNRDVKDNNIVNFINLIQADGYNPLIVRGMTFMLEKKEEGCLVINQFVKGNAKEKLQELMRRNFQPGEILRVILENDMELKISQDEFLGHVLNLCQKSERADHGEGFWSDHWTYNLDLIESYLSIYPEELRDLLIGRNIFSFYHNSHYVLPRCERYVLTDRGIRQYHALKDGKKEINAEEKGNKLRVQNGRGEVFYTNLLCKLLCLIANKVATLDPSGVGIEMEADKPNWYDALNGLPGLTGSSISETIELKRLCFFLVEAFKEIPLPDDYQLAVFEEFYNFIDQLIYILGLKLDAISYWDKSNDIKEHYREKIRLGIDGQLKNISLKEVKEFLNLVIEKTNQAMEFAKDKEGNLITYFYHEVINFENLNKLNHQGNSFVKPLSFKRYDLPIFLEGFVHALRIEKDKTKALEIYQNVRQSPLFDRKLKMYKVNSDLSKQTEEIGRASIFPRGWLENESIWLHMEYKFLLEILRSGLYEKFYENFKNILIPFLRPERYGRSILENSSFIVSSAHEDVSLHGQGFVARLSGSTAEFLHIWLLMNAGARPFRLNEKRELTLAFQPVLAGWLFTKKEEVFQYLDKNLVWKEISLPQNCYAFNFLGEILTVYHNPKRKNTFGPNKANIEKIILSSSKIKPIVINSAIISSQQAHSIRDRNVERIDIYLK